MPPPAAKQFILICKIKINWMAAQRKEIYFIDESEVIEMNGTNALGYVIASFNLLHFHWIFFWLQQSVYLPLQ